MLYDACLRIHYDYDAPTLPNRQLLRVQPADITGVQTLHSFILSISPVPFDRTSYRDFWGNDVLDLAFREPVTALEYEVRARVERHELPPAFDLSIPIAAMPAAIDRYRGVDADAPHHFTCASPRVAIHPATTAYARNHVSDGMTVAEALVAIGSALHADMAFDPEATEVDTPFAEAFAKRRGVCQDFSHIMIAALRGLGIPAGYVSGLLRTDPPPGQARLEGSDAMHAWVRAWCGPDAGWIEYDPTNAGFARAGHIIIAYGRDYADVVPVKGIVKTTGTHDSSQAVDVVAIG